MTRVTNAGVRDVLATVGPLTAREVWEFFPSSRQQDVSAAIACMRVGLAKKQLHICEWTRDIVEKRQYLRAVYALGDKPDAVKPRPLTNAEKLRRSRQKLKIPKTNSIWTWRPNELSALRKTHKGKSQRVKTP